MNHKVLLLGEPGVGKSTCGLSYPGVEQHVFGSTEEVTAKGFIGRKDILPFVKFQWRDCYTDKDIVAMAKVKKDEDPLTQEKLLAPYAAKAKARNVKKYIDYLEELESNVKAGKRPELKAIFLDNWTPFAEDLWTYTEVVYGDQYSEKEQFKIWSDYTSVCDRVLDLMNTIELHAVISCHVSMALDEETSAKVSFFDQAKVANKKDWEPFMLSKYKFRLAGKFDYAFQLFTEEVLGQKNKYWAVPKKARINPFGPGKIMVPKGTFYQFLEDALNKQQGGSK